MFIFPFQIKENMTPLLTTQAALDSCKSKPHLLMDCTDIFEGFANKADEATKEKLDIKVSDVKICIISLWKSDVPGLSRY